MSLEHLQNVYMHYDGIGRPHLKATLAALAFHAHRETGRCFPSFETIAHETGVTARTAMRNVEALIAEGVLEKVTGHRQGKGGRFAPNEYRVRRDLVTPTPYGGYDTPCDMDDATLCRPGQAPCDTGVRGTEGTDIEPVAVPSDLSPTGPVVTPEEASARFREMERRMATDKAEKAASTSA